MSPNYMPSAHGLIPVTEPRPITIPVVPALALEFARRIDRQADAELAEGRFAQAERLADLALEARCRAQGIRA